MTNHPAAYHENENDDQWRPVKSFTGYMSRSFKIDLKPSSMKRHVCAICTAACTHDGNLATFMDMTNGEVDTIMYQGGSDAKWCKEADLALASAFHAALDKDSVHVKNSYNKYGLDRALCDSGRALLALFASMYDVKSGLALLTAERELREFKPFSEGMAHADVLCRSYEALDLLGRLPSTQALASAELLRC